MPDQPFPPPSARQSSLASAHSLGVSSSLPSLPKSFSQSSALSEERRADKQPHHTATSTEWNTADLPLRVAGDAASASCAAGLVAPLIMAVDRSIIENTAQKRTISQSLQHSLRELLSSPRAFLTSKPFGLIFTLYFATYFVANSIDTASSTLSPPSTYPASTTPDPRSPASVTSGAPKFAFTSLTNLSLCVYKDTHFARLFGPPSPTAGPKAAIPRLSMALFAGRDALTVFASFNLPPHIAPHLSLFKTERARSNAAQFLAPAAIQLASTPLHLLGLDLYNRPSRGAHATRVSLADRAAVVLRDWAKSCAARVARIVPAFGVGGVVNASARRAWMATLPSARCFA